MPTIKDRIRAISEKLSYNQGYLGPGKARWGYHAKMHIMSKNGKIRLDDMSAFIQRDVSRKKLISMLEEENSRMRLVYLCCNHSNEDAETPQEIMAKEFNITMQEAEFVANVLDESNLDYREAIDVIASHEEKDVYVGRIKMTKEMFDFAKLYAHSRICGANEALQETKLLRATCNKMAEIDSEIVDDNTRKQMKSELMKFLVKTTDMRKGVVSTTLLNYECSKVFFKWGIVVHHDYTEWTEEAIAMGILWSRSPSVSNSAYEMAELLFPLSCFEMQPEQLIEPTVSRFEELITDIEDYGVSPSVAMAYEFLRMEGHDESYLFKTLLRLSTGTGRRYKKWKKKRKKSNK